MGCLEHMGAVASVGVEGRGYSRRPIPADRKQRGRTEPENKFVLRSNTRLMAEVSDLARRHRRSTNSEVCLAVRALLDPLQSPTALYCRALIHQLGDRSVAALAQSARIELEDAKYPAVGPERERLGLQTVLRLEPGMREQLLSMKAEGSCNTLILQALVGWLNSQRELEALVQLSRLASTNGDVRVTPGDGHAD